MWGSPSLTGRRVAVSGVGKVGRRLVGHLLDGGATVIASDVVPATRAAVAARYPEVNMIENPDDLVAADVDVYAPCALGGALTTDVAAALAARVVCGAANNQLAEPGIDELLSAAGVLYAPDFVVNAGGLIQVADEIDGYVAERARRKAAKIFDTTLAVFALATRNGVTTATAANRLARNRIADVSRLRTLLVP
jgi:valine dehydrogenase (NAD+)